MHPNSCQFQIIDVSTGGYRATCTRSISQSQRINMVLLAYIEDQLTLSQDSYGRVRITEDLQK